MEPAQPFPIECLPVKAVPARMKRLALPVGR